MSFLDRTSAEPIPDLSYSSGMVALESILNHLSKIADEPNAPAERTINRDARATDGDCRA